jgi:polyisoprenoid-binding protein YceI
MRRPIVIALAAAGVLVLAGLGGTYAYFFSGIRTAPKPLALASPPAPSGTPSPGATATAGGTGLAGAWTVAQGSQAGYRVKEVFAGQTAAHEAVARTGSVGGGLTVDASGQQATALRFTAQLAALRSQDQVAGFNVAQRDRIVSRSLSVDRYPDATFQAQSAALPGTLASGQEVTMTIPGQLTIHGTTRPAQVRVQLRMAGSQVQAAGSTTFAMTDYGVEPPQVPITVVDPNVTLEFQLVLARS